MLNIKVLSIFSLVSSNWPKSRHLQGFQNLEGVKTTLPPLLLVIKRSQRDAKTIRIG